MLKHLAHPLSVTLAVILLALLLLFFQRRRSAILALLLAFAWTWLLAAPAVSQSLAATLEGRYAPTSIDRLPDADAIVVLGGGIEPAAEPRPDPNLNSAADRIWFGARLYQAGKAPLVITTGARPYLDPGPSSADAAAEVLRAFGVPGEAIVAPGRSTSTRTDAEIVAGLVEERGLGRVLLVTSALHMPRAVATFRGAGVRVFPAPTDFEVVDSIGAGEYAWLPDADAFRHSGRVLHEYIGLAWYRWRGWV